MLFSRSPHDGLLHALRTFRSGIIAVAAVVLTLGGCSTAPPGNEAASAYAGKSIDDQVRERATKRWQALIRGDLDGAYGFFSRATRDTYPMELYRVKMKTGMWREAKVDSVKCADSVCEVTVMLTLDHNRQPRTNLG